MILSVLGILTGAAMTVDGRYAKAADVERALKDVHQGLQTLHLGQLQARREVLRRELFEYRLRDSKITDLERQRSQALQEELGSLDRRIEVLEREQDIR